MQIKICPRCGLPISWLERRKRETKNGVRVYIYAVHVERKGAKRTIKKCYLGPEDQYVYVTKLHAREGLVLRGLVDRERALEYLEALVDHLEELLRDPELLLNSNLAERLRRVAKKLLEIAEKLEGEKKG